MIKESYLNIELTVVALLFSAVYSRRKTDFGVVTACVNKNQSLIIDCYYPPCENITFNCELYDEDKTRSTAAYATTEACQLTIKDHAKIYRNQTKTYICALSRKTSKEEKKLTVKYTEDRPKKCRGGGPLLHVSKLLWLIAFIFFQENYL